MQLTTTNNYPVEPSSTIGELAERHRISRGLVYKMIKEGRGPRVTKFNSRSIITARDEAAWLESLHHGDDE